MTLDVRNQHWTVAIIVALLLSPALAAVIARRPMAPPPRPPQPLTNVHAAAAVDRDHQPSEVRDRVRYIVGIADANRGIEPELTTAAAAVGWEKVATDLPLWRVTPSAREISAFDRYAVADPFRLAASNVALCPTTAEHALACYADHPTVAAYLAKAATPTTAAGLARELAASHTAVDNALRTLGHSKSAVHRDWLRELSGHFTNYQRLAAAVGAGIPKITLGDSR